MNDTCETVLVNGKNGLTRVNKHEYEANKKEYGKLAEDQNPPLTVQPAAGKSADGVTDLLTAAQQPDTERVAVLTPAPQTTQPPAQMLVAKEGKKWFVVDQNGVKVEREGIEADGYDSEADAWKAVMPPAPPAP